MKFRKTAILFLIPTFLFLFSSSSSFAIQESEVHIACKASAEFAEKIMEVRQAGMPIVDIMDIIESNNDKESSFNEVAKNIIIDAYNEPRMFTDSLRKIIISEFSNKTYSSCVRELGGKF
jgi:transketolase